METSNITRRGFLRATGVLAVPAIVPSSVFGQNAPSNRVHIAAIGVGNRGGGNVYHGFVTSQPDVRVVAATNKNLARLVRKGRFREDLYYRVNVVGIHLPALRQRREDIPLLVEHFLSKYAAQMGKHCTGVDDKVMKLLVAHEWKGNVRELQNVIERAVIFAEGETIEMSDVALAGSESAGAADQSEDLQTAVRAFEKERIRRALSKYSWNKAAAARALGIGLSSLYRKIDELEIVDRRSNGKRPRRSNAVAG